VGTVPAFAIRISYVGELGWEVYAPTEHGLRLWDLLWEAGRPLGATAIGGGAFDSLRLEKGYRLWGADIHSEHDPYEAGLGFAVRLGKGDFAGREALLRARSAGPARRLCCLVLDDPAVALLGREPILGGGEALGYVTSANFGYTVGASIAYGYLPIDHAEAGTRVEIEWFGERHAATVTAEPLYDPGMRRLRET
jgi:dimethylglycine oxidase